MSAKETVSGEPHDGSALTVSVAIDVTEATCRGDRTVDVTQTSLRALVEPMLGSMLVSKLKRGQIRKLIDDLANTPARLRTTKGARLCTAPVSWRGRIATPASPPATACSRRSRPF
jgi:hypothetical protein